MQLPQNFPATWYFFFLLVSVFVIFSLTNFFSLVCTVLLHFLNSSQEYSLSTCFVSRYNGKEYSLVLNSHKHVKVVQTRLYLDKDFNFLITTSAAICCNCLASVHIMYIVYFCLSRVLSSFILWGLLTDKQLVNKSWDCCWKCQNLNTDEGHSPRFRHFQQHSQLLFSYCSNKCHTAYEVFNFFPLISNWYVSFNFHRMTFVIKCPLYC